MTSRIRYRTMVGVAVALVAATATGSQLVARDRPEPSPVPSDASSDPPDVEPSGAAERHVVIHGVALEVPAGWTATDLDATTDPRDAAARVLCGPGPLVPTMFHSRRELVDLADTLCPRFGALDASPWIYVAGERSAFGEDLDAPQQEVNGYLVRRWTDTSPSGQVLATAQWLDLELAMVGGNVNTFVFDVVVSSVGRERSTSAP